MRHALPAGLPGWFLAIVLAAFATTAVFAQNENETAGFRSNHIFEGGQFGENLDILNGGLTLTIPVGPGFQVNTAVGYGLRLNYSSKVWDTSYFRNPIVHDLDRQVVPAIQGPFGIGVTAHFGRIYRDQRYVEGCDSSVNYTPCLTSTWYWVAPDGTSHVFYYDPDISVRKPRRRYRPLGSLRKRPAPLLGQGNRRSQLRACLRADRLVLHGHQGRWHPRDRLFPGGHGRRPHLHPREESGLRGPPRSDPARSASTPAGSSEGTLRQPELLRLVHDLHRRSERRQPRCRLAGAVDAVPDSRDDHL